MKKLLLAILTTVLMFASPIQAQEVVQEQVSQEEVEQNRLIEKLKESMNYEVQILILSDIGIGQCTGAIIKNDNTGADILTAKHCVIGNEYYVDSVLVDNVVVSTSDDLAILKTKTFIPNKKAARLASQNARAGTELFGVGKPILDPFPLYGTVYINAVFNSYAVMMSEGGCSGAGLFNENMELVGILWGGDDKNLTVFDNVSRINKFFKEINYIAY